MQVCVGASNTRLDLVGNSTAADSLTNLINIFFVGFMHSHKNCPPKITPNDAIKPYNCENRQNKSTDVSDPRFFHQGKERLIVVTMRGNEELECLAVTFSKKRLEFTVFLIVDHISAI